MADLTGSLGQQITEVQTITAPAFPPSATPVSGANTGAASAITATLAGAAGKTTYIQGFSVTGLGATAGSVIAITITGLTATITIYYAVPAGATVAGPEVVVTFPQPIAASAANTAVVVNCPSFGAGNTAQAVSAWGYQK